MFLLLGSALAATWYVDAQTGDDARDGSSPEQAVATLTRGAELLGPGDLLLVGPGTYYEQPTFDGQGGQVWIRAEPLGGATVSGNWPEAARGEVAWTDEGDGIWSAEHGPAVGGSHEGRFLFRFESVEDLRAGEAAGVEVPPYGFAHEDGRIHLRLDGADPNGESVELGAPTWGEEGALPAVVWIEDAPGVIFEGFRLEGSATQCLWVAPDSPEATVRNTVFTNCVNGAVLPQRSVLEWSEYSYEGFYDFADALIDLNGAVRTVYTLVKEYPPTVVYEGGLALAHGYLGVPTEGCEFHHNFVHEAFDGEKLGFFADSESHHNVYLYNYDNHVEMEGGYDLGSANLRLHHNLMLACPLGPISHQGAGIVGPQYVHDNVVLEYDEAHGHTWTQLKTELPNATEGVFVFHNTMQAGHTTLFYEDGDRLQLRNNILIFSDEYSDTTELDSDHNLLVNADDEPWLRGEHGAWLGDDPAALLLDDFYVPQDGSPAVAAGVVLEGLDQEALDIGAFELGEAIDEDWPRPRETVFLCDLPERWQGEDPGLCDEPGDTGDSGDSDPDTFDTATDSDRLDSDQPAPSEPPGDQDAEGCACGSGSAGAVMLLGICAVAWSRRSRRHHATQYFCFPAGTYQVSSSWKAV